MLGLGQIVQGPQGYEDPLTASGARSAVEAVLAQVLDARLREAHGTDAVFAAGVAEPVAAFVRRGGKRLRGAFAWCGWRAAGGSGDATDVLRTGAALELLQACALVHDDVMDGSALRRGAPALHVDFARRHRAGGMHGSAESFGVSGAVLAGDVALAWADDLFTETALRTPHGSRLTGEWRTMRAEMVAGQYLDLHAQASGSSSVEEALTVAILKSAMYTVARPMALGACLAGAGEGVLSALCAAGRCVGLAFQLRDDLLGAFGDPVLTGKPADEDLRSRKLTYLLAVSHRLAGAAGDRDAAAVLAPRKVARTGRDVARMRAALARTGGRAHVEAKIAELVDTGVRQVDAAGADPAVRREFAALVEWAVAGPSERAGEFV